jgi:hypothetical protein
MRKKGNSHNGNNAAKDMPCAESFVARQPAEVKKRRNFSLYRKITDKIAPNCMNMSKTSARDPVKTKQVACNYHGSVEETWQEFRHAFNNAQSATISIHPCQNLFNREFLSTYIIIANDAATSQQFLSKMKLFRSGLVIPHLVQQVTQDQPVRRKGKWRRRLKFKPADFTGIVSRFQRTALNIRQKPDSYGMLPGVVKIGINGKYLFWLDYQACFFLDFPGKTITHVFIIFEITARYAPQALIRNVRRSSDHQNPAFFVKNYGRNANNRVLVLNTPAVIANKPFSSVKTTPAQCCAASRTKEKSLLHPIPPQFASEKKICRSPQEGRLQVTKYLLRGQSPKLSPR